MLGRCSILQSLSFATYVHVNIMCLIIKIFLKRESGFLHVKCNKLKPGKSALQLGILFVCIRLTFLIYLSLVISYCTSILMMYKWKVFSVKSHENLHKITLTCSFSFFSAVILESCTCLLLK